MVLLRVAHVALAFGLCGALAACSVVLDPDQITARRAAADDAADTRATPDSASPDSVATTDTTTPDTSDTGATATTLTTAPDAGPDTPDRVIDVRYSGQNGCTLGFKSIPITNCPQACPSGGWSLVFDASASVGVSTFAWRFDATDNYKITPDTATGARVTAKLDVPACELLAGAKVGPAKVLASLSVDGGPYTTTVTLDFNVSQVTSCDGANDCPGP